MTSEWLALVAEISVALAGFAALAGFLGREMFDRVAVYAIVETSLISLVFSLAPHIVPLRVSASVFFFVYTLAWLNGGRESLILRRAGMAGGYPLIAIVAFGFALTGSVLAAGVSLGFASDSAQQGYEAAIFCCLLNSCCLLWLAIRRFLFPERQRTLASNDQEPC